MWPRVLFAAFSLSVIAAEDGWGKVKALASGTELRIARTGSRTPLLAKMDEANDERIVVATKTEQIAIARTQVEKLEFRPKPTSSRVSRETKSDNTPLTTDATRPTPGPARTPGPAGSASSSVSIGGKPDFEVLYVRGRRN
jgi:hypothetical protein